jgi:hypothetical protein
MKKQAETVNRKRFSQLASLVIALILAYVSLPVLNHAIYSYFACDTRCSANMVMQTPWIYHSRKVRVFGFLDLRFEGNALYSSKEFSDYRLYGQAIWVDLDKDQLKEYKNSSNSKYVIVTANFDSIERGHGNLFAGSLRKIEKITIAPNYSSQ